MARADRLVSDNSNIALSHRFVVVWFTPTRIMACRVDFCRISFASAWGINVAGQFGVSSFFTGSAFVADLSSRWRSAAEVGCARPRGTFGVRVCAVFFVDVDYDCGVMDIKKNIKY